MPKFRELQTQEMFLTPIRGSNNMHAIWRKIEPLGNGLFNAMNYGTYAKETGVVTLRFGLKDEMLGEDIEVTRIQLTLIEL